MSDNSYVDWSMIHLIKIPKSHVLYVNENDQEDTCLIEFSMSFSYDNYRQRVELQCDAIERGNSYNRNAETLRLEKAEVKRMLENSIEHEQEIYKNDNLIEKMNRVKKDSVRNRGFLDAVYDNYAAYELGKEYSYTEGEGFLLNNITDDSVGMFAELNFTVSLRESSMSNEKPWKINGIINECELFADEHGIVGDMLAVNFISYSNKIKVDMENLTIQTVEDDEEKDHYVLGFEAKFVPLTNEITSQDLKQIQIKKMKISNQSDTVTGNRILSIRINEEVNKMTAKDKKTTKRGNNDNVKKRFSKILGS